MYNNQEFLEHQEKTKNFSEYQTQMKKIKKITNLAFWISTFHIISEIPIFISSLISFDATGTLIPSFISIVLISTLTILATYKKNKISAFILLGVYLIGILSSIFQASDGASQSIAFYLSLIYIPSILIYILFIKSLYDEDKLKQIEGYPLFDEKINVYSKIYNVENMPCETKINYTEKSEMEELSLDSAENLPEPKTNSYEMESI